MKENWTYKKLGEVATFVNGYPFKPDDWEETGMPIIRIQNLNNPDAAFNFYNGLIDSRYIVNNGDVLISWSGTLGVYEWTKEEKALLNQHIFKVVFDKTPINKGFFKYAVSSRINEMKSKVHGITMQHITKGEFDKTIIPVPPLETQSRIVSELDLLQSIIDKQQAQLKELDKLAQAVFYDMFGDPVENEKGWEYIPLKSLIENAIIEYHLDGNHGSDYPRSEEFVEEGIPYIGANSILNGHIDFSFAKYLTIERARTLKKGIAQNDDVLFAHNATVGPVALLNTREEKVILSTSLTAYRCNKKKLLPFFLKHYMESAWFVYQYKSTMKQTTRNQIPITKQREMLFIIPPLSLQQSFAAKIESIEKQKAAISQSIAETQKLFDYTMDKYFG